MRLGHSLCGLLAFVPDVTRFYFVSSSEVSSQKSWAVFPIGLTFSLSCVYSTVMRSCLEGEVTADGQRRLFCSNGWEEDGRHGL